MPRVSDLIRTHLLEQAGIFDQPRLPDLDSLRQTEWSAQFEQLMRNRLVMGAFRYGLMVAKRRQYAYMAYLKHKLEVYQTTGNLEMLVDVANLALLEFRYPSHPNAHWAAVDNPEPRCSLK